MASPNNNPNKFAGIRLAVDNDNIVDLITGSPINSSLYDFAQIDGVRWNKVYPYQLIVVYRDPERGWREVVGQKFTLPIPPQNLDLEMPFAITTSASLGGIIEEHNGAPFRIIQFTGTTGVLPLKDTQQTVLNFNEAQAIFAGTINAASNLLADATRAGLVLSRNNNIVPNEEFNNPQSSISRTSGYYQYHQLKNFLEYYAKQKQTAAGNKLRLAFAMWKDNSVYLVTPMTFRVNRSSPYEYAYNLAFKAWGRITLDAQVGSIDYTPVERDPNRISKIITTIDGIRGTIEDARKILESVRGDIDKALFTPLREVSLSLKAITGYNQTLADLPFNIASDCLEAVIAFNKVKVNSPNLDPAIQKLLSDFSVLTGKASTGSADTSTTASALKGGHPAIKIFNNPKDFYSVFSNINVSTLRINAATQNKIKTEISRVSTFTRKDYEIRRDSVKQVLIDFCDSVGLGSTTFSNTFGIAPRGSNVNKVATDEDFDIIFNLNNAVIQLNALCVSNKIDPDKVDAIEFIAGLAQKSGIAFTQPKSKFLVPFPYGHTLEQVSQLYLNDIDRWHEIATLNGLREPFVDEVGFDLVLSTNGIENTIQVSDVSNLYIGQFVWISSAVVKPEKRRITGIKKIADGIYIVSLNGIADLSKFTAITQAKIHAYLPDTVNSQMSIYIPSDHDIDSPDFDTKAIPGVDYYDNLVRVGGISLLLDQNNNIIFTPNGGTKLAVGLTNIIQKARIALSTPKGSLQHHPSYGLPVQPGESTADISAKDILKSIQDMFSKDPTFTSITSASVVKNGPTSRINVNIGVAGIDQAIPISADIRR